MKAFIKLTIKLVHKENQSDTKTTPIHINLDDIYMYHGDEKGTTIYLKSGKSLIVNEHESDISIKITKLGCSIL